MRDREPTACRTIAISVSESPDMPALGLTDWHLRDAMVEIARHLLAWGAHLAYGGDLRAHGFTELLLELLSRYRRYADASSVINYLAYPVHASMSENELERLSAEFARAAKFVCLAPDGSRVEMPCRDSMALRQLSDADWAEGLTAMRRVMLEKTNVRVVLGGRLEGYKGTMPGIAEEALLSLRACQPLFLLGGYGGCARDIAETIGIVERWEGSRPAWPCRLAFEMFAVSDLNNGLSEDENITLARTSHVDQAVVLVLRGLNRLADGREACQARHRPIKGAGAAGG